MVDRANKEWLSAEDAAKMLGRPLDDLRRLIRMRRIQHRETDDTVLLDDVITVLELREFDAVMDSGGTEKEARRRAEAIRTKWESQTSREGSSGSTRSKRSDAATPYTPATALTPLIPSGPNNSKDTSTASYRFIDGHKTVSVRQAASLLEITADQVCNLIQTGRLSWCEKLGRTRYVLLSDVEDYKRLQGIWDSKGGTWTPYGKQERKSASHTHVGTPIAASPRRPPKSQHLTPKTQHPDADDHWISAIEAAPLLGVRKHRIYSMIKEAKLTPRPEVRSIRTPWGTQTERPIYVFSLRQVLALAAYNESKRPTISPAQWNRDLRHPIIRTQIVPPPGDRLISTAEAAEILGVAKSKIGNLVTEGRLFGWQKEPGKKGVRLWLSERQVLRYRDDPVRIKHREARMKVLSSFNHQPSTINQIPNGRPSTRPISMKRS